MAAIREGLPVSVVDEVLAEGRLAATELDRLALPRKTLAHRRTLGRLTAEQSDRLVRIPALAVLEVRLHLDLPLELLPEDYVLMRIRLPEAAPSVIKDGQPDPAATVDAWLRAADAALLRVQSVLVPFAYNLLLNPLHARAADAAVISVHGAYCWPRTDTRRSRSPA
jgi:hypothetical protein